MVWDGIVACDLFCAGLGAWMFIFAALAPCRGGDARKAKPAGVIVAAAAVALGALILAVDARGGLLHPLRYFHLLGNLGSVMAWGVIFISLFIVGAVVCIALMLAKREVPRALEIVVAVLALCVSLYTGVLLGTAGAFPLWSLVGTPIAFVASAAYTGYAGKSLVDRLACKDAIWPAWMDKASLILPAIEVVALAVFFGVAMAASGSAAPFAAASVANLTSGAYAPVFWMGVVAVGVVVPFALAFMRQRQGADAAAWMGFVEWACILVGGFAFRYAVVMAAVPMFA